MKAARAGALEDLEFERAACRESGGRVFAHSIATLEAQIKMFDGIFPDEKTRRAPGFNIHAWRQQNGVLAQIKRDGWKSLLPEEFRH